MDDGRKTELIHQLDRARSRMAANRQALARDAEVGNKFKATVGAHRLTWLGGAALVGLVLAKIPPRTKKVVVNAKGVRQPTPVKEMGAAGLTMWLVKTAIDATKPMLLAWATKRLGTMVNQNEELHDKVDDVKQKV